MARGAGAGRGSAVGFALTGWIGGRAGVKESDTGLAPPSTWDLIADKQMLQEEQPLQVARCTKIINPGTEEAKYMVALKPVRTALAARGWQLRLTFLVPPHASRRARAPVALSDRQVRGCPWREGGTDGHRGGHARGRGPDQVRHPGGSLCPRPRVCATGRRR